MQLALDRGYFKEQGLNIETVQAASGLDFVASLGRNDLQVASGSPNAGLFNALNRNIDIRIVADFAHVSDDPNDSSVAYIANPELVSSGRLKNAGDLKGMAVNPSPGLGLVGEYVLNKALKARGASIADVILKPIGFNEAYIGVKNGALAASWMVEPFITQAVKQKDAVILFPAGAVAPGRSCRSFSIRPSSPNRPTRQPSSWSHS